MRLIDADALKTDLTRFYDGVVTAKQLIDEQPTVSGWISVKDRLPMIDENVLVFAQGKEDGFIGETKIAIAYMTDCTYFGGSPIKVEPRWRCPLQFFLTDYEITHWMPLPKPPKEDDDGTDLQGTACTRFNND